MTLNDIDEYYGMLGAVLEDMGELQPLHYLHLTSIARAIEFLSGDKRKIIFMGVSKDDFDDDTYPAGVMLTQEYQARFPGTDEEKRLYEHFLFYPKHEQIPDDPRDIVRTRFSIAHELCHVLQVIRKTTEEPDTAYPTKVYPVCEVICDPNTPFSLYAMDFSPEDERKADLFATILCDQRKRPEREEGFKEPCIRTLHELRDSYKVYGSDIASYLPAHPNCIIKP